MLLALDVVPATSLGPFHLGMTLNNALRLVRGAKAEYGVVEVLYGEPDLHVADITLRFPEHGLALRFDPHRQLLRLASIYDLTRMQVRYGRTVVGGMSQPATFPHVYSTFGPTYPGEYDAAAGRYTLQYPGLLFCFPVPAGEAAAHVAGLDAQKLPLNLPGGAVLQAAQCVVFAGPPAPLEELEAPASYGSSSRSGAEPSFAPPPQLKAVLGCGVFFNGGDGTAPSSSTAGLGAAAAGTGGVCFGQGPQDVISELGPPDSVFVKPSGTSVICYPGSPASPHGMGPDAGPSTHPGAGRGYSYNYFRLGLDVIFDGRTHTVAKLKLHANLPYHPDFNLYQKAQFQLLADALQLPPDSSALAQNANATTSIDPHGPVSANAALSAATGAAVTGAGAAAAAAARAPGGYMQLSGSSAEVVNQSMLATACSLEGLRTSSGGASLGGSMAGSGADASRPASALSAAVDQAMAELTLGGAAVQEDVSSPVLPAPPPLPPTTATAALPGEAGEQAPRAVCAEDGAAAVVGRGPPGVPMDAQLQQQQLQSLGQEQQSRASTGAAAAAAAADQPQEAAARAAADAGARGLGPGYEGAMADGAGQISADPAQITEAPSGGVVAKAGAKRTAVSETTAAAPLGSTSGAAVEGGAAPSESGAAAPEVFQEASDAATRQAGEAGHGSPGQDGAQGSADSAKSPAVEPGPAPDTPGAPADAAPRAAEQVAQGCREQASTQETQSHADQAAESAPEPSASAHAPALAAGQGQGKQTKQQKGSGGAMAHAALNRKLLRGKSGRKAGGLVTRVADLQAQVAKQREEQAAAAAAEGKGGGENVGAAGNALPSTGGAAAPADGAGSTAKHVGKRPAGGRKVGTAGEKSSGALTLGKPPAGPRVPATPAADAASSHQAGIGSTHQPGGPLTRPASTTSSSGSGGISSIAGDIGAITDSMANFFTSLPGLLTLAGDDDEDDGYGNGSRSATPPSATAAAAAADIAANSGAVSSAPAASEAAEGEAGRRAGAVAAGGSAPAGGGRVALAHARAFARVSSVASMRSTATAGTGGEGWESDINPAELEAAAACLTCGTGATRLASSSCEEASDAEEGSSEGGLEAAVMEGGGQDALPDCSAPGANVLAMPGASAGDRDRDALGAAAQDQALSSAAARNGALPSAGAMGGASGGALDPQHAAPCTRPDSRASCCSGSGLEGHGALRAAAPTAHAVDGMPRMAAAPVAMGDSNAPLPSAGQAVSGSSWSGTAEGSAAAAAAAAAVPSHAVGRAAAGEHPMPSPTPAWSDPRDLSMFAIDQLQAVVPQGGLLSRVDEHYIPSGSTPLTSHVLHTHHGAIMWQSSHTAQQQQRSHSHSGTDGIGAEASHGYHGHADDIPPGEYWGHGVRAGMYPSHHSVSCGPAPALGNGYLMDGGYPADLMQQGAWQQQQQHGDQAQGEQLGGSWLAGPELVQVATGSSTWSQIEAALGDAGRATIHPLPATGAAAASARAMGGGGGAACAAAGGKVLRLYGYKGAVFEVIDDNLSSVTLFRLP